MIRIIDALEEMSMYLKRITEHLEHQSESMGIPNNDDDMRP